MPGPLPMTNSSDHNSPPEILAAVRTQPGSQIHDTGGAATNAFVAPLQLSQETPLRFGVQVRPDLMAKLGLTFPSEAVAAAAASVVANVILGCWHGNLWIFYSRDNSHFAMVRASAPNWYTRRVLVAAVDTLTAAGLVEERRTAPSPAARRRSRLCATPNLLVKLPGLAVSDLRWASTPGVVLRDAKGQSVLNPREFLNQNELDRLHHLLLDVEEHNKFLSGFEVGLSHDSAVPLPSGLTRIDGSAINPLQRRYFRIFNGDLEHGGRWYGPWWQAVPSRLRTGLLIDGEPTIEVDYAACQLRLMFAHLGLLDPLGGAIRHADPRSDLYRIEGVERGLVKLALLIAINAESRHRAHAALANDLKASTPMDDVEARRAANRILKAVKSHFPALRPLWFTGIGLRMQRVDSDLCASVQRRMRALGLPALSIHDAFITWRHAEPQLRQIMEEAFRSACSALRP